MEMLGIDTNMKKNKDNQTFIQKIVNKAKKNYVEGSSKF